MSLLINGAALRDEIVAAYGIDLPGVTFRAGNSDAARVSLADRLASAIGCGGPRAPTPRTPDRGEMLSGWTPLPVVDAGPGDPAAATAQLLAWARAGGAVFDALEIRTGPDGYRTAHATRALAAGQRILLLPRDLLFDLDQARRSPVGAATSAAGTALLYDHSLLALALIAARRDPASRWRPYVDGLPARFPGMPVFQDAAALAPLIGSPALADILEVRRAVLADHAVLAGRHEAHLQASLAELAWARAVVATRTFAITIGGISTSALLPIADYLDHGPGDVRWYYDDSAGGFVIIAARDLVAGAELHLSYGQKSNARLLTSYGFCLPDNAADIAQVTLPRPKLDIRGDLLARLLWDRPLGAPWNVRVTRRFDDDTAMALSQARLAVATERERLIALERGHFQQRGVRWLGARNEIAAWAALASAACARLAELSAGTLAAPPTDDSDGSPLSSPFSRAARLLLHGERQVLEELIQLAAELAPRLPDATRWDLQRMADAAGDGLLGTYLRKVAVELA